MVFRSETISAYGLETENILVRPGLHLTRKENQRRFIHTFSALTETTSLFMAQKSWADNTEIVHFPNLQEVG